MSQITVEERVKKTYEVDLPCYMKKDIFFYYVINEQRAIQVCTFQKAIQESYASHAFLEGSETCTREEFLAVYREVKFALEDQIYAPIKKEEKLIVDDVF